VACAEGDQGMIERSREWTEADLLQLIATQVQENIGLDYKRAAALSKEDSEKKDKIRKAVSAFANSAGGVVVYGMAENGHVPTQLDPVDPHAFSKEWLENVIISNVQPRIDGLHINPVSLSGANAGRVAYVVTIPQSLTAHQAPDNRYYKRFNFQSVPMEHYEVQDTMNRAKTPIVNLHVDCKTKVKSAEVHEHTLSMYLENQGIRAAQHMKLVVWFPRQLSATFPGLAHMDTRTRQVLQSKSYEAGEYMIPFSNSVLFPMDTLDLHRRGIYIYFEMNQARHEFIQSYDPRLEWIVFADDMLPRSNYKSLRDFDEY
jgi:hypothetical protein